MVADSSSRGRPPSDNSPFTSTTPSGAGRSRAVSKNSLVVKWEQDIRLAVGVHRDHVSSRRYASERPCVLKWQRCSRGCSCRSTSARSRQLRVDLHAVTRVRGKNSSYAREVVPSRVAEDRDPSRRRVASRGVVHQHRVPVIPGRHRGRLARAAQAHVTSASHTECSACPRSARASACRSGTRPPAYWYPSRPRGSAAVPVFALSVPPEHDQDDDRRGRERPAARAAAPGPTPRRSRARIRKVRQVPTSGIRRRADASVPASEPAVDSAYRRPATVPASSTDCTPSRMAQGETVPSRRTGTATSTSTATSDPGNAPAEIWSTRPPPR